MLEKLLPGAAHVQNLHPMVVHFPLALLPAALFVYAVAWVAGRETWAWAALWMLVMGSLGAVVAAASGLYVEDGVMIAESVKAHLLEPHERLMLTTTGIALVSSAWALLTRPWPRRGRAVFVALMVAMVVVMVYGADFGARMVYDYNAAGNACSQPIEFTK